MNRSIYWKGVRKKSDGKFLKSKIGVTYIRVHGPYVTRCLKKKKKKTLPPLTNIVQRGRLCYICFKNKQRNLRVLKTNDSKRKKNARFENKCYTSGRLCFIRFQNTQIECIFPKFSIGNFLMIWYNFAQGVEITIFLVLSEEEEKKCRAHS